MLILKVKIIKKISLLFILIALANLDLFALHVNLTGPTEVCPGIDYIYTVYIETDTHINVTNTCEKDWWVYEDGSWNYLGRGGQSMTIRFNHTGPAIVSVGAGECCVLCGTGSDNLNIDVRLVAPAPITGPTTLQINQTGRFFSQPYLTSDPEDCNWHHEYMWTSPSGWKMIDDDGSIHYSSAFDFSSYVDLEIPTTATSGVYEIQVKGVHDLYGDTPTRTFRFTVGTPEPDFINNYVELCEGDCNYIEVEPVPGSIEYQWEIDGSVSNTSTSYISICTDDYTVGSNYIVSVRMRNSLGWSDWNDTGEFVIYPEYVCGGLFSIFPNPASNTITIQSSETNDLKSLTNSYDLKTISIISKEGNVVYKSSSSEKQATINISTFKPGLYLVEILYRNKVYTKKLYKE